MLKSRLQKYSSHSLRSYIFVMFSDWSHEILLHDSVWASLCQIVSRDCARPPRLRPIWLRSHHSGSSCHGCPRPANRAKAIKALAAWLPSTAAAVTSCHASCLRLTPLWPFYNPYWLGSQKLNISYLKWYIFCGQLIDRSISHHMTSHDWWYMFPVSSRPWHESQELQQPELFVTFWLRLRLWTEGPGWVTDYYYASSASHDLCEGRVREGQAGQSSDWYGVISRKAFITMALIMNCRNFCTLNHII